MLTMLLWLCVGVNRPLLTLLLRPINLASKVDVCWNCVFALNALERLTSDAAVSGTVHTLRNQPTQNVAGSDLHKQPLMVCVDQLGDAVDIAHCTEHLEHPVVDAAQLSCGDSLTSTTVSCPVEDAVLNTTRLLSINDGKSARYASSAGASSRE